MKILHFLASGNFITYNKTVARIYGERSAIIIGLFATQHLYYGDWFFCTYEKIEEETALNKHKAMTTIKKLIEKGIIHKKKEGIPCKTYYRIDNEKLMKDIDLQQEKESTTSSKDFKLQEGKDFNYNISNKVTNNNVLETLTSKEVKRTESASPQSSRKRKLSEHVKNRGMSKPVKPIKKEILNTISEVCVTAGFNHKINTSGKSQTKLIYKTAKYIEEITSGKMFNKHPVSEDQTEYIGDLINGCTLDTLKKYLLQAAEEHKKLKSDKRNTKKLATGIDNFIYNEVAERSWFLQLLREPPSSGEEQRAEQVKDSLPDKVQNIVSGMSKDIGNPLAFWSRIKDIYDWHQKYRDILRTVEDSPFAPYAYRPSQFFKLYTEFADEWSSWGIGNVGVNNETWKYFEEFMQKKLDIDIRITEKRRKKAEK